MNGIRHHLASLIMSWLAKRRASRRRAANWMNH
jgi:hypothetical protein